MANISIKSDKITPFGGIFPIMEQFDSILSSTIDGTLGKRCESYGYQYSEIIRSLMCVYFCGGSCIEDVATHLKTHLSRHPKLRTCGADTLLGAIEELTQENITYKSDSGKDYDFNTACVLNELRLNCLFATGQLKEGGRYDVDFAHQFIEAEKYDAKPTYKKFLVLTAIVRNIYTSNYAYRELFKTGYDRIPLPCRLSARCIASSRVTG